MDLVNLLLRKYVDEADISNKDATCSGAVQAEEED